MTQVKAEERAERYRSIAFREVAAEVLGGDSRHVATVLDALLEAKKIPCTDGSSEEAASTDAAAFLVAHGSRQEKAERITESAERLLRMPFRLEYGVEAVTVEEARHIGEQDPHSWTFGFQLAKLFRDVWTFDPMAQKLGPIALTIGWDGGRPNLYGFICTRSEAGKTTKLFSTATFRVGSMPSDTRLDMVEIDLVGGALVSSASFSLVAQLFQRV